MRSQPLWISATLLLFSRCAQVVPLTGGERDTLPPKLLSASPASATTQFTSSTIELRFDEFVQVKDLSNQLIVSPRMDNLPDVEAQGRTVVVTFEKKALKPNTTYRISFGNAIADMNESNSLDGLTYVFSTGDHIDTLTLAGSIITSPNQTPSGEVTVGLYLPSDTLSRGEIDSLPIKVQPVYMVKSNSNGGFSFSNLPAKSFTLFAFTDLNRNAMYDPVVEKVAFVQKSVHPQTDSSFHLRLFQELPPKVFVKKSYSPYNGYAEVILNTEVRPLIRPYGAKAPQLLYLEKSDRADDTLHLYYETQLDTLGLIVRSHDGKLIDTLDFTVPPLQFNKKRARMVNSNANRGTLANGSPVIIQYPVWMDTLFVNQSRISLWSMDDSSRVPFSTHWLDVHRLEIAAPCKGGNSYRLKVDTGSVRDLKRLGFDSLTLQFKTISESELGKLILQVKVNSKQAYVVQLMNGDKVTAEQSVSPSLSSSNAFKLDFPSLAPGTYRVRVIFDDNANGTWDTGSLLLRKQPERVFMSTKELKILSDWEVEEQIQVIDQE